MPLKRLISLACLIIIGIAASGQTPEIPGFRFLKRLRGVKINDSKVQEIKIDEPTNNLVISYRAKNLVYLSVYKMYSWDNLNVYRIDNRIELYNSYFDAEGANFYLNYDLFNMSFFKIDVFSGQVDTLNCNQTPQGCQKIEQQVYQMDGSTVNKYYYFKRDDQYPNDILVYIDQQYFKTKKQEYEAQEGRVLQVMEVKDMLEEAARFEYGDFRQRPDAAKAGATAGKQPATDSKTAEKTPPAKKDAGPSIILTKNDILELMDSGSINRNGITVALEDGVKIQFAETMSATAANSKAKPLTSTTFQKGDKLQVQSIFFEQGKSTLLPESYPELDRIADLMKKNAKMKIQINGHINNVGTQNLEVSEKRAKAVVDYLILKGIPQERLSFKGYGDSQPIASNETDEGKKMNRRMEFVVTQN